MLQMAAKKITKKFIDEIALQNVTFNNLKKEIEATKNELKEYAKSNDLMVLEGTKFMAVISERNKPTLNQEKAVEVVLKAKAKWLLKQIVDEDKLEEAIRSGEIDAKLFVDCYTTKTSSVISFKKK